MGSGVSGWPDVATPSLCPPPRPLAFSRLSLRPRPRRPQCAGDTPVLVPSTEPAVSPTLSRGGNSVLIRFAASTVPLFLSALLARHGPSVFLHPVGADGTPVLVRSTTVGWLPPPSPHTPVLARLVAASRSPSPSGFTTTHNAAPNSVSPFSIVRRRNAAAFRVSTAHLSSHALRRAGSIPRSFVQGVTKIHVSFSTDPLVNPLPPPSFFHPPFLHPVFMSLSSSHPDALSIPSFSSPSLCPHPIPLSFSPSLISLSISGVALPRGGRFLVQLT